MTDTGLLDGGILRTTPETRLVWLVEDDLDDAVLIFQAMEKARPADRVVHLTDYESALRCLQSEPEQRPSLILLASNPPDRKAFRFLEISKTDEVLTTIPIVVLAKSCDASDVLEGFALGAAGYVVKSNDSEGLREQIAIILTYWTINQVPRTQPRRSRTDQTEAMGPRACLRADLPMA